METLLAVIGWATCPKSLHRTLHPVRGEDAVGLQRAGEGRGPVLTAVIATGDHEMAAKESGSPWRGGHGSRGSYPLTSGHLVSLH